LIGAGERLALLEQTAKEENWAHVQFLPFQDRKVLRQSLNLADVHLVSQLPEFTGVVVPSKLFGVMAVGKPAVMVGPTEAECSRIILHHGAGYVVHNGDVAGLVERLRELQHAPALREQMGNAARAAFEKYYDRQIACGRLEQILQRAEQGIK
jgi:glycosyltransferase involved in cell wall biosynthesis